MTKNLFKQLFGQLEQEAPAPWTQPQREALLDLLIWMIFVDRLIAAPEDEQIQRQMKQLTWEGDRPLEIFFNSSIRRAREVLEQPEAQISYLEQISRGLGTAEARQRALRLCREMAMVDGEVAEAEAHFLDRVRSSFGLGQDQ